MMKQNINGTTEDNNKILSLMLADEIQNALAKLNPSADDLLNTIPTYKVVYK